MWSLDPNLGKVFAALCEDAGTPFAKTLLELAKNKRWGELFTMKVSPGDYSSSIAYMLDNSLVDFLRKLDVDVGLNLEEKAEEAFYASEHQCLRTNLRLSKFESNASLESDDLRIWDFIAQARKNMRDIVGGIPDDLDMAFGKGSTFCTKAPLTTVPDKIENGPSSTEEALALLPLFSRTAWARSLSLRRRYTFPIVKGNRFDTVSKDSTKRRGICVEPALNLVYQLAVGRRFKEKLMGYGLWLQPEPEDPLIFLRLGGLDLVRGQPLHRELARAASKSGRHATIDLSNASDTVAKLLVKLLFSEQWYELMSLLRSPKTFIRGRWVNLEKFSSMGNGFTFELETLIFAVLALTYAQSVGSSARLGQGIWVYGDDIILESDLSDGFLSVLKYFGFTPNERKTFTKGPFRESCGGDFFDGDPVRAHYVKKEPEAPADWIALANGIRRLEKFGSDFWNMHYKRAWYRCLDQLPANIRRIRGPESLGDLVVNDPNPSTWRVRDARKSGRTEMKVIQVYQPIPEVLPWTHWNAEIQLAAALYGAESRGVTPRGAVSGYREEWIPFL